ncbi:MAG: ankyrin repeat domain-containing protein [Elusimicrobiaceae bacterium]|nr:ankyrin repeat domain-containing protein [Elusimicrobiaceae bacterium]
MKKTFLFLICLFVFCSVSCFAQNPKRCIDRIGMWRADLSCGMELGQLIRTYKDDAVIILSDCCKRHKSACLDTYSSPDNKTLLYTAIETKSYAVARFLFNLSSNYIKNIDAYGMRKDYTRETDYIDFIETKEDSTSKTPLMLACSNGDLTGTKLLINYGANLFKKNYTSNGTINKSAYDYAKSAKYKDPGFMDFVQKEYIKQIKLYGEDQSPKQNRFEQDFEILDFTKNEYYQEQFL